MAIRPVVALRLLLAALALGAAALLIFQPDGRDRLRAADQLFAGGRYHEALAAYTPLATGLPEAQQRVGLVRAIRGERTEAERALRAAMQRGLAPADYHLALLYLGRTLADAGRADLAARTWLLLEDCRGPAACAYRAAGRALAADEALARGDYLAAAAGYRAALAAPMPPGWAAYARYRLALLAAVDDPAGARDLLAPDAAPVAPHDALLAPLLPPIGDAPGRLEAVLAENDTRRSQLLGQLYLSLSLYGLAEEQFARVDPHGPEALSAAAYAAYTRWRAGDAEGGLARLEALVTEHPEEPGARTLLALAYLTADAEEAARDELDAVARLKPTSPDVEVAWASWYAARREYDQASLAYGRAVAAAPPAERGPYALLAARFHLATTYELCEVGLPLAEQAVGALPGDAVALTTVAAQRYHCGQFVGAADAARAARAAGAGPDAAYYLGAALAALGERDAARVALISAADLAPASDWRRRAELALAALQ
jgi:Flp pilus assembly protein TadD